MKLGAVLFAAVALDALTFASVAALPGVLAYEQNPMTRSLVGLLGMGGFVWAKLAVAGIAAVLIVRARGRVRVVAGVVALVIFVGAGSNLLAIHELADAPVPVLVTPGPLQVDAHYQTDDLPHYR